MSSFRNNAQNPRKSTGLIKIGLTYGGQAAKADVRTWKIKEKKLIFQKLYRRHTRMC